MGKTNNSMMKNTRGAVGDAVFKKWRGRTLVANRPGSSDKVPTAKQAAVVQLFKDASRYAKLATGDPERKALYQAGIGGKKYTAYSVAMTDYLNAPTVREIKTEDYHGVVNDELVIIAADDFKVTRVNVVITSAAGVDLESGDAVQDPISELRWHYKTTVANAALPGTRLRATAYDVPKNTGTLEKVL